MLIKLSQRLLLVVIFFLISPSLLAILIPPINLDEQTRDSSIIVAGKVTSVLDEGTTTISWQGRSFSARSKVANLQVTRVLKGQQSGSVIAFRFVEPEMFLGFGGVATGQFGLFFLKSDSQQRLTVTNPYYPSVVSSPDAPKFTGSDLMSGHF
jgi:hypothetical protein